MSEVPFQLACDCGGAPGAWAVDETLRTLMRKTIDPLAQGRIGKLERVGDGLQTLPLDDVAHSLGTAEDAGVFGVLYEGVSGRHGGGGKTQFQSPHLRVSSNKLRQKYAQPTSHDAVPLLSAQNLFDSNFPEAAYTPTRSTGSAAIAARNRGKTSWLTRVHSSTCGKPERMNS